MRGAKSYALLEVTAATYVEIRDKLIAAGYGSMLANPFHRSVPVIQMDALALQLSKAVEPEGESSRTILEAIELATEAEREYRAGEPSARRMQAFAEVARELVPILGSELLRVRRELELGYPESNRVSAALAWAEGWAEGVAEASDGSDAELRELNGRVKRNPYAFHPPDPHEPATPIQALQREVLELRKENEQLRRELTERRDARSGDRELE